MNGALDSAVRLHLTFFILLLSTVDDFSRQAVVHVSTRGNDFLNTNIQLGTSEEMAGTLRSDDAPHHTRSSRDQDGTAMPPGPDVLRKRQQNRIIVLNSGRIQALVENDGEYGSLGNDHFRNVGR